MDHRVVTCFQRGLIVLMLGIAAPSDFATAQTANPFVADQENVIQQVSLTDVGSPLAGSMPPGAGPDLAPSDVQFRVSIRYLLVDAETRRQIYSRLVSESIRRASIAPESEPNRELTIDTSSPLCIKRLTSHGHSATCVLDTATANEIVKLASESSLCTVSQAPAVNLQQNLAAQINDMVQRPMLVDVDRDTEQLKPVVRIVDEGTRIRLLARSLVHAAEGDVIELATEFTNVRILAVNTFEILGLTDKSMTFQAPVSETTTIVASERLVSDQLVLIDPHITNLVTIEVDKASMLGRLPVVGKAFAASESKQVENHLMVLIKPDIYAP